MKKKKTFLILLLAFVLLLGGAAILYRQLGDGLAPDRLSTPPLPEAESSPEPTQSAVASETPANPEVSPTPENTEPSKMLAPDFTVYDAEGNEVHLSDFVGKPTVVNFWASWCGPCKMEMPDFQEKYQELGEEVNFLMVNATDGSRETVEKASAFIDEQDYTFPVFYDHGLSAAATYGVYGFPTTFFIDAEGYGIAQATGAIDGDILQRGIDMTLSE